MSLAELRSEGFESAGRYEAGQFELKSEWRKRKTVYIWMKSIPGDGLRPVRVGIACPNSGMQARYTLYNRWLAGLFKPDDAREQQVRALMQRGLGDRAEVWAIEVPDRKTGLALEDSLRLRLAPTLDLDLMVKTSWIKSEMRAWSAANKPGRVVSIKSEKTRRRSRPLSEEVKVTPRSQSLYDMLAQISKCEQWVVRAQADLSAVCNALSALGNVESGPGIRYRIGRSTIARLHPKMGFLIVGFPRNFHDEAEKYGEVSVRKESVWFYVRHPEDVVAAIALIGTAASKAG